MDDSVEDQQQLEALLLAYVDGRLSQAEMARVEEILQADAQARHYVELMRQSELPYREAFDASLAHHESTEWVEAIDRWHDQPPQPAAQRSTGSIFALSAVLVIGLLVGFGAANWSPARQATPAWLAQVASYHELYVRETIASSSSDAAARTRIRENLAQLFDTDIVIPDLSAQGFEFKRGQLLQIEGMPLMQLAYLPEQGTPVALCLTRRGGPDLEVVYGSSHNLQYANWSRDGISYLLLGSMDREQLRAAAQNAVEQLSL